MYYIKVDGIILVTDTFFTTILEELGEKLQGEAQLWLDNNFVAHLLITGTSIKVEWVGD